MIPIAFLVGLALGVVVGAFVNEVGWWLAFYDQEEDERERRAH